MDAFRKQGWTDNGFERWKPRKKNKDAGRAILVKTGKLRRSIKVRTANWTRVVVGSYGIDYAQIHNEGGSISKGASSRVLHFKHTDEMFKTKKGRSGTKNFISNTGRISGERAVFSKERGSHFSKLAKIGAHSINMPKRQFIGNSQRLERELKGIVGGEFLRVLKK